MRLRVWQRLGWGIVVFVLWVWGLVLVTHYVIGKLVLVLGHADIMVELATTLVPIMLLCIFIGAASSEKTALVSGVVFNQSSSACFGFPHQAAN